MGVWFRSLNKLGIFLMITWVVSVMSLLMAGFILIAVKLFQDGHFYAASLLLVAIGSSGLFVSLGMHMKIKNQEFGDSEE